MCQGEGLTLLSKGIWLALHVLHVRVCREWHAHAMQWRVTQMPPSGQADAKLTESIT